MAGREASPSPRVLLSGIDGLDALAYGDVAGYALRLHSWKAQAQASRSPVVVRIAEEQFRVLPAGWRGFPYVLEHARGFVGINPDTGLSRRATVKVSMRAEALHGRDGPAGEVAFWEAVILPELFGSDALAQTLQISRLDIHVDVAGLTFDVFGLLAGFVGRWHRIAPIVEDGELAGVAVGVRGGPVYARLYDKLRHIADTGESTYLLDVYGVAGIRSGESVWRLEFELRREMLVGLIVPIRTASDAIEHQGSLWRYCTTEWLRLAVPSSATRRERWVIDDKWSLFQDAPVPSGPPVERENRQRHAPRLSVLLPILRGCAVKGGAQLGAAGFDAAWRRVGLMVRADAEDRGLDLDGLVMSARLDCSESLGELLRDLARFGSQIDSWTEAS
jgi:hypothetical protein